MHKDTYFPFVPLLGIMFIGLKLGSVITWSWLWVLSPFWLPVAVLLGFWLLVVFGIAAASACVSVFGHRNKGAPAGKVGR